MNTGKSLDNGARTFSRLFLSHVKNTAGESRVRHIHHNRKISCLPSKFTSSSESSTCNAPEIIAYVTSHGQLTQTFAQPLLIISGERVEISSCLKAARASETKLPLDSWNAKLNMTTRCTSDNGRVPVDSIRNHSLLIKGELCIWNREKKERESNYTIIQESRL